MILFINSSSCINRSSKCGSNICSSRNFSSVPQGVAVTFLIYLFYNPYIHSVFWFSLTPRSPVCERFTDILGNNSTLSNSRIIRRNVSDSSSSSISSNTINSICILLFLSGSKSTTSALIVSTYYFKLFLMFCRYTLLKTCMHIMCFDLEQYLIDVKISTLNSKPFLSYYRYVLFTACPW